MTDAENLDAFAEGLDRTGKVGQVGCPANKKRT